MRYIKTKKGEKIKVDAKHFDTLSQFTWYIDANGYAITTIYVRSRKESRETGLTARNNLVAKGWTVTVTV